MKRLQTHSHSEYCLKNRHNCKFGFPFQPVQVTHFYSHFNVTLRGKLYVTKRSAEDAYMLASNYQIYSHGDFGAKGSVKRLKVVKCNNFTALEIRSGWQLV